MRNYGLDAHYEAGGPGLNGKMTEMQAIIGQYDLRRLGTLMEQRQLRARLYRDRILSEARSRVTAWPPATAHTFKDFTIILPDDLAPQRPSIVGFLRQQGIETRTYFCPPVHEQRYFRQYAERALPRTESLARRVLTLPFYAGISEEDIDYVVAALRTAERLFAASGTV
jgi:dTDP-4-amino-4,6-dideoxygalactose transaminase